MRKESLTGLGIILFCIVLVVCLVINNQNEKSHIHDWATTNGYEIVQIEQQSFLSQDNTYVAKIRDQQNQLKWIRIHFNNGRPNVQSNID